ncbi:hypothetical protein ACIQXD_04990 [Streptomyces uncialis]|uniref:hypothetical protein n=1 Tax=Streptomyces uncialis TaxID=1048205 RepID=UPI0037F7744F
MIAAACSAPTCLRTLREHELDAGMYLCTPCVTRLHGWLASIPRLMVLLEASRGRETTGQPSVTGTRTAPLPGREDVLNLLGPAAPGSVLDVHGDQCGDPPLLDTLGGWVRLALDESDQPAPHAWTPQRLAHWLAARTAWISAQPWSGELHDEVHGMMRVIWGITAHQPRRRPITQPCPRCDTLALSRVDGEAYTSCSACDALFSAAELAIGAAASLARTAA